jgi:hypothetical protein
MGGQTNTTKLIQAFLQHFSANAQERINAEVPALFFLDLGAV